MSSDFWTRNGFARRSDLQQPALCAWRDRCIAADVGIGGSGMLDWSRQWEYPYALANLPEPADRTRVLDAGSGFRFFTLLLAELGFDAHACDVDAAAGRRLDAAARARGLDVAFRTADLERLPYADADFDAIACVSVLEHTASPERVIAEFSRCLRPGGRLVLTFDVSLDGDRDIALPAARALVDALEAQLVPRSAFADLELFDASRLRAASDVLRTAWFRDHEPERLPWRVVSRAMLQTLRSGRVARPFFDLAVIGVVLTKPA